MVISGDDATSSKTSQNIKETLQRQLSEKGEKRSSVFKQPPPRPFIPKDEYVPLLGTHYYYIALFANIFDL